jgi:hypothetical protein
MPQKRPITPESIETIEKHLKESYSQLLTARSVLSGYFKKTEDPIKDIETIVKLHRRLNSDFRERIKEIKR